jgi:glycosyltransferase involved in cell wall biosynthesis
VIPHLNEPDLRSCLLALEAQRTNDMWFEIIVVDNGSAEMPVAACSGLADVRLTREPIPGPGPARNHGAAMARADVLAFIDADCVAQPGWVRAIVEMMRDHPEIDLLGGDIGILKGDPQKPSAIEAYESIYSYRARLYVERYGFAATGNMAVRTSVFHAVGPFGGISTMEDTEWGQRATSLGYRIAYLDAAKVLTPSCKSFAELARRWDRHVAHAFGEIGIGRLAKLKWLAACAIMAASPLPEFFKVMASNRVEGMRSRVLAMMCLTRVRLYRARLMLDLARHGRSRLLVENWNREGG